jgi:membrane fusion protein (multidrug efflux system)
MALQFSVPRSPHGSASGIQFAAAVLALAVGAVACGHAGQGGPPGGGPVPVTVVTLKSGPVLLVRELPGRTSAYRIAEVRPQATGIVKQRLFTEGALVHAGQPLFQLDDAVYRAHFQSSSAALARAEAAAEVARLAAQRAAELVKTHAISAQDNDTAQATSRQTDADVAAARAALEATRVDLAYTRITSPITGRIGRSFVTPGALVTANQAAAIATVQQLDPLYVEVSQASSEWLSLKAEIDAGRLKTAASGTRVGIVLDGGRRYAQDGKLEFSDVTVDVGTGTFVIKATVPNAAGTLLPGMFVRAIIDEGTRPDAILAPQVGIQRNPRGGATALVVGAGNKVELRTVTLSRELGDQWLIDDGLKVGDRVIVEGVQKVMPGAEVQPVEQAAPAPAAR